MTEPASAALVVRPSVSNWMAAARRAWVIGAAHGAWLPGWSAVWGALIAAPNVFDGDVWAKVAALSVLVWLVTWSRELEDPGRRPDAAVIPGGRRALSAAALAVAAVLGLGPLAAVAAWLAIGLWPDALDSASGALRSAARLWIIALGAWLGLGGGTSTWPSSAPNAVQDHMIGWLSTHALDVAILAGCAFAVRRPGGVDERALPWTIRGVAFTMLAIALVGSGRPAGVWLAALCVAAVWPRFDRPAAGDANGWQPVALPLALAAVCGVDRLLG